jgi:pimeloyl-ACP methyl ester carboxylesterase
MFADENVKRMDEAIKAIIENATISEHAGIIACLRGMKNRDDMNDFLTSFAKPLLMIFGAKDNYIPKEAAETLIAKFHTASHLMLHDSGHSGFLEEPDISATKLLEFVKD